MSLIALIDKNKINYEKTDGLEKLIEKELVTRLDKIDEVDKIDRVINEVSEQQIKTLEGVVIPQTDIISDNLKHLVKGIVHHINSI